MDRDKSLAAAACSYAELGYAVFPCVPGQKVPLTEHGFKDATTDLEQIERWWLDDPMANIGLRTDGLLVVDVDGADNPWPADRDQASDLSVGPVSITPHGGRHHIFREPEGVEAKSTVGRLAPSVDTRARGAYILVSPSVVDRKAYRWVEALPLEDPPDALPEPPAWLAAALESTNGSPAVAMVSENPIPDGQRNATLARLAGTMRRVGMSQPEILAALLQVNQDRCQPPLPDTRVERIAASIGRYEPDQIATAVVENHWAQVCAVPPEVPAAQIADPGPVPGDVLHVPGFIAEVMDYCLRTAPYPNRVLAFSGALTLLSFLAGRKVRDPGDNRTNIYILGLAHSAAGKDWPRKVNTRILHEVGLSHCIGERFASGEGVQDALFTNPCMLFQTDEIDGMLQQIHRSKDARHESIMTTLLTMYSAASSVFPMRCKAGNESPGVIDQPCLVLFGTAIPNHYYEALSERMLTSGFFARMLILEGGKRAAGQEPTIEAIPPRVLETARWWADYQPGRGDLEAWHPAPAVVEHTPEARGLLIESREEADAEYAAAEAAGDPVGTTVWGRVSEQTRKLALIYAISESHTAPLIGVDAVRWAYAVVMHQTRRMLFMATEHVAVNPFEGERLRLVRKLREAADHTLAHSVLLKRMKVDAKTFQQIITTLEQRGNIAVTTQATPGRPSRFYTLLETQTDGGN